MLEIKDGKKILTTPVSAEDLKDIHAGDIIYLNGSMTTCRDVAHRRLVEEGRELPVDVKDAAIFHAGPIIRPLENDKFEMVSVGPTTSICKRVWSSCNHRKRWNERKHRACM